MIIVLLLTTLTIIYFGFKRYDKDSYNTGLLVEGVYGLVIVLVPLIIVSVIYTSKFSIDDRIALYESQNQQIQ